MKLQNSTKDFIKCGIYGWGFECLWSGLHSILSHNDKEFTCRTSMWMFPIYGLASLIKPMHNALQGNNFLVRGIVYTTCIFATEYGTGKMLQKKHCCPWDYSDAKLNIEGLVRLDYAPLWFIVGLMYEKILNT
jgi:uncharacterized membrane protein